MRAPHTLLLLPTLLLAAACSPPADEPASTTVPSDPVAEPGPAVAADAMTGTVTLSPTEGNQVSGTLAFSVVDGVVHARGEVRGLGAGTEHGFHVHEAGDCSAPDASSAGGHFNPATSDHGRVGHGAHHGGDSDNLKADANGVAVVDARFEGVTLGDGAATDIMGKAVIVHADADDYTSQPTGNAGARLACGVIAVAQ